MSLGQSVKINNYQRPVDLIEIANRSKAAQPQTEPGKTSFKDMFSRELANSRELYFSKHAQERLYSRGISLAEETVNKIADAVDKADQKGSRETLILTDEAALVVSIKNRTVITAFDRENLREGVVTAIDSAVII
jgi:flagellar operon protein